MKSIISTIYQSTAPTAYDVTKSSQQNRAALKKSKKTAPAPRQQARTIVGMPGELLQRPR